MSAAAVQPTPGGEPERSKGLEHTDDDEAPEFDGRFTVASASYLIYYNLGTIVFGFAEPRDEFLIAPIFAVAGVFKLVALSDRITPRALSATKLLLPMIVAIALITATASGWWPL